MKIKVLAVAIVLSIFSAASFAANGSYKIEEAIESSNLEIRLANNLTGIIKGKQCDKCQSVLLKITPNTKVKVNGFVTVLTNIRKCSGKPSTVIYNIKSREVTSVSCER